jgi:hypothetical protein
MKLYAVSRVLIFTILIDFDLFITHAGELFIDAIISDEDANKILARWPNSIQLLY